MTRWNDTLLAKLQTLMGERGQRADHAVRWRDLPGGAGSGSGSGSTIILGGAANDPRVDNLITDMDSLNAAVTAAQEAADLAAINALTADQEAQSVREDHDALVSTFTGNLADLDATLTSVQADLSDAYDSLTGQIRASALSAYYTSAQTDTAIVASSDLLQASIVAVRETIQGWQLVTDSVADVTANGDTTLTQGATALGQPGTVIVSQANMPLVDPKGAWVEVPMERAVLFSGQRIKIGVLARAPAVNPATRFGVTYATTDGDDSGYMESGADLAAGWQWFTFFYDVPTAIAGGPGYLFIFGDADLAGNGVEIARIYIEIAAVAGDLPEVGILNGEITDIKGLDLDALDGTAFGALLTQLDVDAGGLSATITTQASAISTLEGNASAGYLIRAQAGNAVSLIDLVAADGSGLTPSSFVRIAGDDILLDGSVAARKITVHNNADVFEDNFLNSGSLANWTNMNGSGELAVVASSYALRGGTVLRAGNNSGDDQVWYVSNTLIPFDPEAIYRIRAGIIPLSGANRLYIGFVGVASDGVTLVNSAGANTLSSQHYGVNGIYPALGVYEEHVCYLGGHGTGGNGTLNTPRLLHPDVAFVRPMVLMNYLNASGQWLLDYVDVDTVSDATLIEDGTVTARKLIGTEEIITRTAQIGTAVIQEAHIGDAQITNAKIGSVIQSNNFIAGDGGRGWRILKSGAAEFNTVKIRRQIEVASGSYNIGGFIPSATGGGPDSELNENWVLPGKNYFRRSTSIDITAWNGVEKTYLATCGMTGTVGSNNAPDCFWGWTAELLPLTRWNTTILGQNLRVKMTFWSRNVTQVNSCTLFLKIYEVS